MPPQSGRQSSTADSQWGYILRLHWVVQVAGFTYIDMGNVEQFVPRPSQKCLGGGCTWKWTMSATDRGQFCHHQHTAPSRWNWTLVSDFMKDPHNLWSNQLEARVGCLLSICWHIMMTTSCDTTEKVTTNWQRQFSLTLCNPSPRQKEFILLWKTYRHFEDLGLVIQHQHLAGKVLSLARGSPGDW